MKNNNIPKDQLEFESQFNPVPLFRYLLHKAWLIILVTVVCALAAYGMTKLFVKPTYRSSFTAYVNNQHSATAKDSLTSSDILASHELVETYSTILMSNSVLTAASEKAGFDYSYAQLKGMISTKIMDNTEVITVYAVMRDPNDAYLLASSVAEVAPEYIKEVVEGSSMKIIDKPEFPIYRHGPSYVRASLFGALAGLLLILVILIISFFKDDTITDDNGLEERFALPLLGVIPDSNEVSSAGSNYEYEYQAKDSKKEEQ